MGFPGGKESTCQCRFNPWFGNIPWRRKWQLTPVFLPGKSHGQRSLVGYSPWGHKRVGHNSVTKQQQHRNTQRILPVIVLQEITTIGQLVFCFVFYFNHENCSVLVFVERSFKKEGTHVYLWLIHVFIWQKAVKFFKAIVHQFKNKLKKKHGESVSFSYNCIFFFWRKIL